MSERTKKYTFEYPQLRRDDNKETFFGVEVEDPYRYLEDCDSEETKKFIEQQNKVTEPYINSCPYRQKFKEILTENQNYERAQCYQKKGDKYYFQKNPGIKPQPILYELDNLESEPRVFFDPNTLSEDGSSPISIFEFSPKGTYFAYGVSNRGSDWIDIHVLETATHKEVGDVLKNAKFTKISWTSDEKGFFYCSFPNFTGPTDGTSTETNTFHAIVYHRLERDHREDSIKVIFSDKPDALLLDVNISEDGKYFFVRVNQVRTNLWYYCELNDLVLQSKDKFEMIPLYLGQDEMFDYVGLVDQSVYFITTVDAPNGRLCKLDLSQPLVENWQDILHHNERDLIYWGEMFTITETNKKVLLIHYVRNVMSILELYDLEGNLLKTFKLEPGTVTKLHGFSHHDEFFFFFTSFITPGRIYHYKLTETNLANEQSEPTVVYETKAPKFQFDQYKIDQVWFDSKDGTKVPMFIVCKKNIKLDGSNPCFMYGYGGFGIKFMSGFACNRMGFCSLFEDGFLAVANIRGGGELGRNWYKNGVGLHKQNGLDDFAAAAEFLIKQGYTTRDKLAIESHSNGGILMGASCNQRPDLFGACINQVGVMDLLRFHKFTVGHAWIEDYGHPEKKEGFENLIKFSPYHNIPTAEDNTSCYPAMLVVTSAHDDRVVPAHSFKFIARLQYNLGKKFPTTPFLVRIDTNFGHGGGKPVAQLIDDYADIYSFLYNSLDLHDQFKPEKHGL